MERLIDDYIFNIIRVVALGFSENDPRAIEAAKKIARIENIKESHRHTNNKISQTPIL